MSLTAIIYLETEHSPDEFDNETKEICSRIKSEDSALEIAQTILDVFEEWMDVRISVDNLIRIVEKLRTCVEREKRL